MSDDTQVGEVTLTLGMPYLSPDDADPGIAEALASAAQADLPLANAPHSRLGVPRPGGSPLWLGPADQAAELRKLTDRVRQAIASAPLWPGHHLITPPTSPARMPY